LQSEKNQNKLLDFTVKKSEELLERRKNIVANGVGIFNTATVASAKDASIIDVDGNE
jgi:4-aminobutyrate aminotransferase/(S)-3-amino-2-methylpropionate transaminase